MNEFSWRTRQANLKRMAEEQFDLLIIGGGITGAGAALDAAARRTQNRPHRKTRLRLRHFEPFDQADSRRFALSRTFRFRPRARSPARTRRVAPPCAASGRALSVRLTDLSAIQSQLRSSAQDARRIVFCMTCWLAVTISRATKNSASKKRSNSRRNSIPTACAGLFCITTRRPTTPASWLN